MTRLGTRTILAAAVVLAAAASMLSATTFAKKSFTCPLDGTKFEVRVVAGTDSFGGVDSDFCAWPGGEMALPYKVQVCPTDFYAALNDYFDLELPADLKTKLKAALKNWRDKHPEVKTVDDLTPPQRWELTAVCAVVKHNDPRQMGALWLRTAWAQRQTGLKDFKLVFGDPITAFEVVTDAERDIKREKKAKKKLELRFQMLMGAHRAGDVARRDKCVAELGKEKLDEAAAARLEALKKSFAAEAAYQKLALDAYGKALAAEAGTPKDRVVYQFLVADINRRLGRKDEALKEFRKLLTMGEVRPDIKDLAGFMIDWLSGE